MKKWIRLSVNVGFYVSTLAIGCSAFPGELDSSFGTAGIALTPVGGSNDLAQAVAIQPDGKILVGGLVFTGTGTAVAIVRYNPSGTLDTTFDTDGRVVTQIGTNSSVFGIAIQSDNKIVVVGNASGGFLLARYLSNGSLDSTFGLNGVVQIDFGAGTDVASDLAILDDGKIIVVGHATTQIGEFGAVRCNPNGSLDDTFGFGGKVVTAFPSGEAGAVALAIQPDRRIVVSGGVVNGSNGNMFGTVRYNSDGSLDMSFGVGGKVTTQLRGNDPANDVAIQTDGKIVVAGSSKTTVNGPESDFALIRYEVNGSQDTTFGTDGKVFTQIGPGSEQIRSLAIEPSGKILAVGYSQLQVGGGARFALVRYLSDGSLDLSFNNTGKVVTSVGVENSESTDSVLQSDGKVVVVGVGSNNSDQDFATVRYNLRRSISGLFDFDGDNKTDISIFRPSTGAWHLQRSTAGFQGLQFGADGDKLTPADYDGDGKTDISIYRPSTGIWYILNSSNGTVSCPVFGVAEDLPAPGDYDGDGKADLTVFRPSQGTWYRQNSANGSFFGFQFGANGDVPTVGDFDGDGKNDLGIWRPSNGDWYNIRSSNGSVFGERFGQAGDRIAPADYDGDGKTDIAIFRPSSGLWVVRNSATATYSYYVFGAPSDIPISGDYDGDGKADIGVWRPSDGTWYVQRSDNGQFIVFPWGQNGDVPTPSAFGN